MTLEEHLDECLDESLDEFIQDALREAFLRLNFHRTERVTVTVEKLVLHPVPSRVCFTLDLTVTPEQ
jgi:hypothetical protein